MVQKRVLLLGAGAMGRAAAQRLVTFPEVEALVIADRDEMTAGAAAEVCGAKATAVGIDINLHEQLLVFMRRADVVLNCVGPFFHFGARVLEAALTAGIDYLDICDDPEPTRELQGLDQKAKAAGITAIVGLGASPGITSLLGARARAELDETDELVAGWNIEEDAGDGNRLAYSAALVHWMQQCSGRILECDRGRLVEQQPLRDVHFTYPGRGSRTLYTVGHPEPVSFHYSYPELRRSFCVMVMPDEWTPSFRELADQIDRRRLSLEEAAAILAEEAARSNSEALGPAGRPQSR